MVGVELLSLITSSIEIETIIAGSNAALANNEKPTAKRAIINLHVKRPPKVPWSLRIGHGPIWRNFVSPRDAVINEILQFRENQ